MSCYKGQPLTPSCILLATPAYHKEGWEEFVSLWWWCIYLWIIWDRWDTGHALLTLCPYTKTQAASTSPRPSGSCGRWQRTGLPLRLQRRSEKRSRSLFTGFRFPVGIALRIGVGTRSEGFRSRPRWVYFQAVSLCMISVTSVHECSGSWACFPGSSLCNEAANVLHKATGKRNGGH